MRQSLDALKERRMHRKHRWIQVAAIGTVAWAISTSVQHWGITPRYGESPDYPWPWEVAVLLPLFCAGVSAGVLSRSFAEVLVHSVALVAPGAAIAFTYGVLTGNPIGHDIWVTDSLYSIVVGLQFAASIGLVGLTAVSVRMFQRWRHGV